MTISESAIRRSSCSILLGLLLVVGSVFADDQDSSPEELPTIAAKTSDMSAKPGLFKTYPDPKQGKVWLELPAPGRNGEITQLLYVEGLLTGLGSNPVGLDRGQLGDTRLVTVRRIGNRVLFEQENLRFRAMSDDVREQTATRHSFATSVIWGHEIAALADDGRSLVDFTSFLIRDAHDISDTLEELEEGEFSLDPQRSAVDFENCLAFPDNLEFEAILTYAGKDPGQHVSATAPTPEAFTVVQHHSLIRLPDDGYQMRAADPRIGFFGIDFFDYAASLDDTIERYYVSRHRLIKKDPSDPTSPATEPLIYYVDSGAPEPIRSALVEGASWWAEAFAAAGFPDTYRVEVLPPDKHPLDVRNNVIQWVHRSTRGWSYGGGVIDPRTGEILKGHVSLGSLRVRQDRRIFEGLLGTSKTGTGDAEDPIELALARIRQLAAHEVGHTLGITHNFVASSYGDRESVMDYPAPWITVDAQGHLDCSRAYGVGIGDWDIHTVRYGYTQFAEDTDEAQALQDIVRQGMADGLLFLSDGEARPAWASDPRANLWDNGQDAVDGLEEVLAVRRIALESFAEDRVVEGAPLASLQEVLAPIYFFHRYQLEAAAKTVGGMEFEFAMRGDGQAPTKIVSSQRQRRALEVVSSLLDAEQLDIPESVLPLLTPRPFGHQDNVEMFDSRTQPAFDALGAASTAANQALGHLLQPDRLARMVDFHRRNKDYPGVQEVFEALEHRVFTAEPEPRLEEIQRQNQFLLADHLARLIATPTVRGAVQAEARQALTRVAGKAGDDAHGRYLKSWIHRFFERPIEMTEAPSIAAPPPPGSPIGSSWASGCSTADVSPGF